MVCMRIRLYKTVKVFRLTHLSIVCTSFRIAKLELHIPADYNLFISVDNAMYFCRIAKGYVSEQASLHLANESNRYSSLTKNCLPCFSKKFSYSGGNIAISSIPVGDESVTSTFFADKVLPLIVDALTEYLKLDIIEIPQSSTAAWVHGWGSQRVSKVTIFGLSSEVIRLI